MTNEEAIKIIKQFPLVRYEDIDGNPHSLKGEALRMAIEALEKQIPKKYTMQRVDNIFGAVYRRVCPTCRDRITISEDSIPFEFYCRKCGVRLVLDTTEETE